MSCDLLKAPFTKLVKERENSVVSWALKTLSNTTDSTQCNSGNASDDDRLSHGTNTDLTRQEQPDISTTTPQAGADEPYHVFGNRMKWVLVAQIGVAGTFSGLSSNIYFPCLKTITELIQGIAPLIWGTLSDKLGRRQVYVYSFMVYIVANIVLGFSPNLPILFAFRGLQAFGSASVVSIGNGVIQDIALPVERGGFMSIYQALLAGLILVQIIILLPETLRLVAGNGSVRVKGIKYKPLWDVMSQKRPDFADHEEVSKPEVKLRDFWEPLHMLGEMDTLLTLVFGGVVYSMWSMMTGTTTMLLAEKFGLNELHIGFAYLPNGIGTCAGSALAGWLMDKDYKSTEAIYKDTHRISEDCSISPKAIPIDFPIEKARFRHVFWVTGLLAVFSALYGASFWELPITSRPEWIAVPLALQFFIAGTSNMIFAINSTLITDLHPGKGAGATAINNLARCTMSAGAVPLAHYMIKRLGTRPTFFVLAAVVIFCMPLAIISRVLGMKWRRKRMRRIEDLQSESRRVTET
ncbi:hypothetical protein INS49_010765 [Diaporthe citri]|uniref:uncharacterized protein n=1 Tax=Diaporthe citri TaxID=83186 RepID=UPI001C816EFE|nr:uncharacterized protein INS49_010765 [Diaporthe citri]KAG6359713.1 hypothetical protein INS49_010765 [Diaporthe citri]